VAAQPGVAGYFRASWYFTQPDLARCVDFKWDWLAQIRVRNFALTWLVYGDYHPLLK